MKTITKLVATLAVGAAAATLLNKKVQNSIKDKKDRFVDKHSVDFDNLNTELETLRDSAISSAKTASNIVKDEANGIYASGKEVLNNVKSTAEDVYKDARSELKERCPESLDSSLSDILTFLEAARDKLKAKIDELEKLDAELSRDLDLDDSDTPDIDDFVFDLEDIGGDGCVDYDEPYDIDDTDEDTDDEDDFDLEAECFNGDELTELFGEGTEDEKVSDDYMLEGLDSIVGESDDLLQDGYMDAPADDSGDCDMLQELKEENKKKDDVLSDLDIDFLTLN